MGAVRPSCFELVRPSVLLLSYLTADYRASKRAHAAQMGALREGDPEPQSTGGQADDAQERGGGEESTPFAKSNVIFNAELHKN